MAPPWAPKASRSDPERRADLALLLFDLENGWIEDGMGCSPGENVFGEWVWLLLMSKNKAIQPQIRLFDDRDAEAVVGLSLRAWAPVFASIEQALGSEIFGSLYPEGWRASQRQAVQAVCASQEKRVWVAGVDASTVGFVAVEIHPESSIGEIYMLAVDPDYQGGGIGTALTEFALARVKDAGMAVAMVESGGDPGHAAARRTYEKGGYTHLPIARYFRRCSRPRHLANLVIHRTRASLRRPGRGLPLPGRALRPLPLSRELARSKEVGYFPEWDM